MQLTYRGISYTPSQKVSAPKTHQLIYRGVSFDSTLNRVTSVRPKVTETESSVKLVYRGLTYNVALTAVAPYTQPRVLNWRYQVA